MQLRVPWFWCSAALMPTLVAKIAAVRAMSPKCTKCAARNQNALSHIIMPAVPMQRRHVLPVVGTLLMCITWPQSLNTPRCRRLPHLLKHPHRHQRLMLLNNHPVTITLSRKARSVFRSSFFVCTAMESMDSKRRSTWPVAHWLGGFGRRLSWARPFQLRARGR